MNLIDLPDLMRERSEHDPVPVATENRIAAIQRKVTTGRRRQIVGTMAAVVVLALLGFGVSVVSTHGAHQSTAAAKSIKKFPEYASGAKLVDTATGPLSDTLTTVYVPTRLPLLFAVACRHADPDTAVVLEFTANGHDEGSTSCGESGYAFGILAKSDGLVVGSPATFTFTPMLTSHEDLTSGADPGVPAGTVMLGLYQSVPVAQYPLPKRPAVLPSLDIAVFSGLLNEAPIPGAVVTYVNSDPKSPLEPESHTFTYPACRISSSKCFLMALTSQTPGTFTFAINGVVIGEDDEYTYDGDVGALNFDKKIAALGFHAGDPVTVTVTPTLVTGAWQFGTAVKPTW